MTAKDLYFSKQRMAVASSYYSMNPTGMPNYKEFKKIAIAEELSTAQTGNLAYNQARLDRIGGPSLSAVTTMASKYGISPIQASQDIFTGIQAGYSNTQSMHMAGKSARLGKAGQQLLYSTVSDIPGMAVKEMIMKGVFGIGAKGFNNLLSGGYNAKAYAIKQQTIAEKKKGLVDPLGMELQKIIPLNMIYSKKEAAIHAKTKPVAITKTQEDLLGASIDEVKKYLMDLAKAIEVYTGFIVEDKKRVKQMLKVRRENPLAFAGFT